MRYESPPQYGRVPPRQVVHASSPRRRRRRLPKPRDFKWFLLGLLLLAALVLWLSRSLQPAISWVECMEILQVEQRDRERYTQLAFLGVLISASLAVYRVLRK
jgi:predicted nucleic acid-binding Zn ribbon protein